MNERIAELYEQALVIEDSGDYVSGELDPAKFAELIVLDCLDAIHSVSDNFGSSNPDTIAAGKAALLYAYRSIQHRFGVK